MSQLARLLTYTRTVNPFLFDGMQRNRPRVIEDVDKFCAVARIRVSFLPVKLNS